MIDYAYHGRIQTLNFFIFTADVFDRYKWHANVLRIVFSCIDVYEYNFARCTIRQVLAMHLTTNISIVAPSTLTKLCVSLILCI